MRAKRAPVILFLAVGLLAGLAGRVYSVQSSIYKDAVDEKIKAGLKKIWSQKKHPKLIMDKIDHQCFKRGDDDRRVRAMLKELTDRKYTHTLAVRVKSGYPDDYSPCRESDPGWYSISAHSTAQAFDIFYADGVEIAWQIDKNPAKRKKAQAKIRQILKEVFAIGRTNDDLLPNQILSCRREDILAFRQDANALYGGYPPDTGLRGMMSGDRYWDRIHIGY